MDSPEVEILQEYDRILLGAYTWGDGDLPDDFLDFYDGLETFDLTGKHAVAFGFGDTGYPAFCGAVDLLQDKLVESGATVPIERLKMELFPEEEEVERCEKFAEDFLQSAAK